MAWPTLTVEFSPGEGPFDTPSWVDITSRVKEATWTVGRQKDLEEWPPGEATLLLGNRDRLFDPDHAAGTYYGLLNPRTPFRIRANYSAVDYDEFTGFVEDGFEQIPGGPADSWCQVRLVDMLAVLNGTPLPGSVYDLTVAADSPVGYWKLGDTEGSTTAADSSGNGHDGDYRNDPVLATDTSLVPPDPSRLFNGSTQAVDLPPSARSASISLATTEAWIQTSTTPTAGTRDIIYAQWSPTTGDDDRYEFSIDENGYLHVIWDLNHGAAQSSDRSDVAVNDGQPHHVLFLLDSTGFPSFTAITRFFVDGVETGVVPTVTAPAWNTYNVVIGGHPSKGRTGNYFFTGYLSHVAIYDTILDDATILAHYEAGISPWDGDTTGERITHVLDTTSHPAGARDIATGEQTLGPAVLDGAELVGYMQLVARTEWGALYVNHHDAGKLKFRSRYELFTATRSTTSQYTFTDADTPGAVHYERGTLVIEANGIGPVINQATVTYVGGEVTISEPSSLGPRGQSFDTIASTPYVARSLAEYIVARNKDPKTRIRGLEIDPAAAAAGWPAVLGARIGDRVTVRRHPQVVGTAQTTDCIVEGVTHTVTGRSWRTSFYLSDADTTGVALYDVDTYDDADAVYAI